MTATLDGVANKRKDKPEPTAEQKLAEELVARAREQAAPHPLQNLASGGFSRPHPAQTPTRQG
jgi:hypothetical protein